MAALLKLNINILHGIGSKRESTLIFLSIIKQKINLLFDANKNFRRNRNKNLI
jgi:hypothetical protein